MRVRHRSREQSLRSEPRRLNFSESAPGSGTPHLCPRLWLFTSRKGEVDCNRTVDHIPNHRVPTHGSRSTSVQQSKNLNVFHSERCPAQEKKMSETPREDTSCNIESAEISLTIMFCMCGFSRVTVAPDLLGHDRPINVTVAMPAPDFFFDQSMRLKNAILVRTRVKRFLVDLTGEWHSSTSVLVATRCEPCPRHEFRAQLPATEVNGTSTLRCRLGDRHQNKEEQEQEQRHEHSRAAREPPQRTQTPRDSGPPHTHHEHQNVQTMTLKEVRDEIPHGSEKTIENKFGRNAAQLRYSCNRTWDSNIEWSQRVQTTVPISRCKPSEDLGQKFGARIHVQMERFGPFVEAVPRASENILVYAASYWPCKSATTLYSLSTASLALQYFASFFVSISRKVGHVGVCFRHHAIEIVKHPFLFARPGLLLTLD